MKEKNREQILQDRKNCQIKRRMPMNLYQCFAFPFHDILQLKIVVIRLVSSFLLINLLLNYYRQVTLLLLRKKNKQIRIWRAFCVQILLHIQYTLTTLILIYELIPII